MAVPSPATCPCGTNIPYAQCCMPYHTGAAIPPNAETLMRSRYTAYVLKNVEYLAATWHPSRASSDLNLDDAEPVQWIGLKIKQHVVRDDHHAIVEFVARYKINGRAHRLHEVSRFVREEGRWYYLDGEMDGGE